MQTLGILKDDFYNLKSISLNYFCSKEPLNKKYLRLYGHHLCPFVEKARLALCAKGVQWQDV